MKPKRFYIKCFAQATKKLQEFDTRSTTCYLSIMIDKNLLEAPVLNIRGLLTEIALGLDGQLRQLRTGTRYASVRDSDIKVFMRAFDSAATVSEIARKLQITRQAVHASVQRLMELKIVELQSVPHNSRDKLVVVTERGRHAQETALQQIKIIEDQMAAAIGRKELETLRHLLSQIAQSFKQPA